jgi:hypothetical protein
MNAAIPSANSHPAQSRIGLAHPQCAPGSFFPHFLNRMAPSFSGALTWPSAGVRMCMTISGIESDSAD